MRRAAELQSVSAWSWQRFLVAIICALGMVKRVRMDGGNEILPVWGSEGGEGCGGDGDGGSSREVDE